MDYNNENHQKIQVTSPRGPCLLAGWKGNASGHRDMIICGYLILLNVIFNWNRANNI